MRSLRRRFFSALALCTSALIALFLIGGAIGHSPSISQAQPFSNNQREIRGVWITNVDSNVLFDRDRLSSALQDLAGININTLYPVVWNWGYTTYPSPTAQTATGAIVDPRPYSLEKRDVLSELVKQGHQRKMAVLPWFEFGFMAPEDSALAIRHPNWLTQRQDGSITWQEGIYPRVWLNPFKPEVQQFILNLILEIVTQYDVDGIQFDDHMGLPYEFGYDPFTVQLYRKEHQGKAPPSDPKDPEWVRWRANKITNFMGQVFRSVKARKSDVLVALSPNNYEFSYNHSLQDWRTWERQGLIEELTLQVYASDLNAFTQQLKTPQIQNARRHIPTAIGILAGIKRRTSPIKQIQEQVKIVRQQKFAGVSFFFYETMWNLVSESATQRKAGFQSLFPTAVDRPSVLQGWRSSTN